MKKKMFLFLALLWFICSFLIIKATYAKYISSISSNTGVGISGWKLLLNDQDIIQNSDFSSSLELTFPGDTYYDEDVIVPGAMRIL